MSELPRTVKKLLQIMVMFTSSTNPSKIRKELTTSNVYESAAQSNLVGLA
jgi:hypothetical protein